MEVEKKIGFFSFFKFIYFERKREREGERENIGMHPSWGGAERERRERIPSRLHAVIAEPGVGIHLTSCEIMT